MGRDAVAAGGGQHPWQAGDPGAEARLILRAKAGDRRAFSQLVSLHQGVIRAYVCQRVRTIEAADDLAQEVFLTAYRRLGTFEIPAGKSMRPWLFGIARNLLLEYLRAVRQGVQGASELESLLDQRLLERVVGETDPARTVERELEALARCLDKLSPGASALVSRHYFQQQTLAQLAAEQNKKESAIRMQLLRIREALRTCIRRQLADRGGSE